MISQKYKKGLSFHDFTAEVMYKAGEDITRSQRNILRTYYVQRTRDLERHLASRPFAVMKSSAGARLVISYMKQIRFMDLRLTAKGKKKRLYHPIYNKPVYGYIYGYAYNRLRYGFVEWLRQQSTQQIKKITIHT